MWHGTLAGYSHPISGASVPNILTPLSPFFLFATNAAERTAVAQSLGRWKDEKAKSASGDTATKTASIFLFVPTGLINPMDRNSNIYDKKIHQAKLS